jgi:hypothetical protein
MQVLDITADNSADYPDLIPEDILENTGRKYYRGQVLLDDDDNKKGCLVWEYKNVNDSSRTMDSSVSGYEAKDVTGIKKSSMTLQVDSFKKYYANEDYFGFVSDRKKVLKSRLCSIFAVKVNDMMSEIHSRDDK